jgi:hypothetical protein
MIFETLSAVLPALAALSGRAKRFSVWPLNSRVILPRDAAIES